MELLNQIRRARQSKDTLHYAQIPVMNSFGPAVSFSPLASGICELFSFT